MDKTKTDVVTSTSTFTFNYKSSWEHICSVFARPLQIIGTFVGIFGAFWMLYEASVSSLELSPNRFFPYLAFLGISVVAALGVRVYQYVNEIPDGLESVNRTAQRIAQLRRPLWEFRFAKSVLAEKLSPIDNECSDLLNGNVFVHASQPNDIH